MTLKAAVDEIDSWSISGFTNLGLQGSQMIVNTADLPALVLLPGISTYQSNFPPYSGSAGILTAVMRHMVLTAGLGVGLDGEAVYDLVSKLDTYLAHVRDNVDLNGELVEAMQFQVLRWPSVELYRQWYVGAEVQMIWHIAVA